PPSPEPLPESPGPREPVAAEPEPATAAEVLARLDRVERVDELSDLTARWHGLLARYPAEVAGWLVPAAAPRTTTVAVAASVLDPHAPEAPAVGADTWLRAAGDAESQLDKATQIRLMAFLLALAFTAPEPEAAALAARAFATIDQAAASGEL